MSQTLKATRAPISRISSLKRQWDDEKDEDETPVDWPASQPKGPLKKIPDVATSSSTSGEKLSPAERRLRAIQAAITQSDDSSSADTSTASTSSSNTAATSPSSTSVESPEPTRQSRIMPWDAKHGDLKAAQRGKTDKLKNTSASSTSTADQICAVFLSSEQRYVLQRAMDGENVFFTGSAGTGKSVLLREIIRGLREKYSKASDAVAITAPTGLAACNIGGTTLHSFSGAGICAEPVPELVKRIRRNKKSVTRWLRTKALVIDEVSMVDGDFFGKLSEIAKLMRPNKAKPFGGIQLILTGDFFQLPPVTKGFNVKFAFEAAAWEESITFTFNLTQVFRQKDQEFVDMLNRMRIGEPRDSDTAKFKRLSRALPSDGTPATELFPRREDVDRANATRMRMLNPSTTRTFKAIDGGTVADPVQREKLLANFLVPSELELCVESQVMMVKNFNDRIVNGSLGHVLGFCDSTTYIDVDRETEQIIRSERTYDNTEEGAKLRERFEKRIKEGKVEEWPVVKFQVPNDRPEYLLVTRDIFKVEQQGEVQASRSQLPLILSWALSIHKSQGQTLDRVRVDLGRVFEKGQAYVALSRATSLEGLQVLNFDASKVRAHPKVIAWYKTLPTVPIPKETY